MKRLLHHHFTLPNTLKTAFFFSFLLLASVGSWGQVSMTTTGSYLQDFNTLSKSGTSNTWSDNITILNWYSQRTGTGTTYEATSGGATAGNMYSYGSTSNSERAIGSLGSSNAAAGNFAHGVLLRNTSGVTITDIKVTYTLEEWRKSGVTSAQDITFYYKINSSAITTLNPNANSTWTQVTALTLSSPINTSTAATLDGNASANRVTATNISIPSLSLANNDYIMLKWEDPDHTGSDHGLGIDDITISWTVTTSSNDQTSTVATPTTQVSAGYISSVANNSAAAVEVFKFKVSDLGSADGLATKVTQVKIKKSSGTADWTDHIAGASLWDGATQISTGTVEITDGDITFPITSGNLDIANNTNKELTLKIWLKTSNIVDNATMVFSVPQTSHGFTSDSSGSSFATDFGSAVTGNTMTIQVNASKLLFVQQPTTVAINVAMSPAVSVKACDENGNIDTDIASGIEITSTGTLTGSPVSGSVSNGLATFSSLTHTVGGTGLQLTATKTGLTSATSNSFTITAPPTNDLCANAINIIPGSGNISGTLAASSYSSPFTSYNDVWYKFTPTCTGSHTLLLSNFSGDADLYVFDNTNSCPASTTALYSSAGSSTTETITNTFTKDKTYYIRIKAFNTTAENSFTINVSAPTPATGVVVTNTASSITVSSAILNGSITTLGVCPTTIEKGFVYALTSANADPEIGGTGVTTETVSGLTTGSFPKTITGLSALTNYSYKAYIKDELGTYTYGTVQTFTTLSAEPTTQPTNLIRAAVGTTTMTISWDAATSNPDGYIVVRRNANTLPNTGPDDGTTYAIDAALGNGFVAYVGNSLSVAMSGLSAGSAYNFTVYSYNGSGSTINYNQTSSPLATGGNAASSFYTLANEPAHSNVFTLNALGDTTITFNVQKLSEITNGAGYNIIYKEGNLVPTTLPTDGQAFATSGDAILGANTNTTTVNTMQVTGLEQGKTYSFLLIPYGRYSTYDSSRNYNTNATIPSLTVTLSNKNSDVVAVTSSEPASISSLINDADPLTSTTGKEVWKFTIRDGGSSANDTDALPTKVSAITIAKSVTSGVVDFLGAIKTAAIFDSANNFVATASSITATSIVFNGLNLTVANNNSETYSLRISLKETISDNPNIDGKDFGFSISNTNITALTDGTSSRFSSFSAATSTNGTILVDIAATQLVFTTQPQTLTSTNATMNTITVSALDVNGNVDNDYVQTINLTSTGTLATAQSATAVAGVATFSNVVHSSSGIGLVLTASDGTLSKTSTTFDIMGAPVALEETNVTNNSFTANWNTDAGATNGYELEVSTSPDFVTTTINSNVVIINNSGTTGATNWTETSITQKNNGGDDYLGMLSSSSSVITPALNFTNFSNTSLNFMARTFGGTSNNVITISISTNNGGSWTTLGTRSPSNSTMTLMNSFDLSSYTGTQIKIRFQSLLADGTIGVGIDNIEIKGDETIIISNLIPGYNPLVINNQATNSASVTGIAPNIKHYYRLRSVNGSSKSAYSNVIIVEPASCLWTGSAWTNGTGPTATTDAIIDGDFTTNDTTMLPFTAQNLTVNNGKTLTISADDAITVENAITNNGTITVEDDASLVQTNDAAVNSGSGVYNVKKTTGNYYPYDYIYWSSPVANLDIDTAFPSTAGNYNLKYYIKTENYKDVMSGIDSGSGQTAAGSDGFDDNSDDYQPWSDVMKPGVGYAVIGTNSPSPFNPANTSSQSPFTVTFSSSTINNGEINNVTLKEDAFTGTDNDNMNLNLVGNPYPSSISTGKFFELNEDNIEPKMYFWTHAHAISSSFDGPWAYNFTNDSYASATVDTGNYTVTSSEDDTGLSGLNYNYIPSGQGFLVAVKDGRNDNNLLFNNSMRGATYANNNFLRTQNTNSLNRIWLSLNESNGIKHGIAIGFSEANTDGLSANDVNRIDSGNDTEFYSLIPGNTGDYDIQFLAAFQDNKTIPLGMEILQSGNYQISLNQFEGIFTQGQAIYLEDTYQGIIHDFANGAYSFTQNAGANINDRFILRFTNSTAGNTEQTLSNLVIYPNPSTGKFYFHLSSEESVQIEVSDLTGKRIQNVVSEELNGNYTLNLTGKAAGVYFAKITTNKGQITKKLVIE